MQTIVILAQLAIAIGIFNVWILRWKKPTNWRGGDSRNLREEFESYGLSVGFMKVVGSLKLLLATLLIAGIWLPTLVKPAAIGLGLLMLGAVLMHLKVRDPLKKSLPAFSLLVLSMIVAVGSATVNYETPNYRVVDTIGDVEIREYEPYLAAQTTVDGSLESAGSNGFRILAKYIFGDNHGVEKIAMTTPVSQEKSEPTKIAMTTPVTQEQAGDKFNIRFMMPSEYSKQSLPTPNDPRIKIEEVPAQRFAAIRYSGRWSKKNYEKNLDQLLGTLEGKGYEPTGEPIWARYNDPFTPWFLRRNEILTAFRVPGSVLENKL